MTDNEIIKALKCCQDCNCKECPCCRIIDGGMHCTEIDEEEILDLINRQKAEIERLQKSLDNMTDALVKTDEACRKAETEVIKEFAERLKEKSSNFGDVTACVVHTLIDNLVKEMVGDGE